MKTPVGYVPSLPGLDVTGMDIPRENVLELTHVDSKDWIPEVRRMRQVYAVYNQDKFPAKLHTELNAVEGRLLADLQQAPTTPPAFPIVKAGTIPHSDTFF